MLVWKAVHAVALTSEPEDKLVRKLSKAVCAVVTLPELSAEPISDSSLVNELELEVLDVALVESEELLVVVLLVDEPLLESLLEESRLVSESYADCASVTLPELMALKRLSTSFPSWLMLESLEVSLEREAAREDESVLPVLGVA